MRIRAKVIIKNYELEEARIKHGYTQKDFAEIVGIPIHIYQEIEFIKRKPNEEEARNMSLELGVPVSILFPEGYEKIVDVFKRVPGERIADFQAPLLESDHDIRILETTDAKMIVGRAIEKLPKKERAILEMRHGLVDGIPRTYDEIGKHFGVTRERTRQIEAKANEKMREIIGRKK